MSTLIVTLPPSMPTPTTPCSVVWAEDDRTVKRHLDAPLSLLPATPDAEVVVLVPVGQLSWHRLDLPKGTLDRNFFQEGNAQRLRSVLDGLLEERILDEPAQVHFAIEPGAQTGAPTWVAACDRTWLSAWLTALEHAGRTVARIVPEMAPLTANAEATPVLLVVGTPDHAQLVCCSHLGLTVLPLTPASVALLTQAHSGDSPQQVIAEPAVAELAEQHFRARVSLQTAPQRAVAAAQSAWDLAQFDLLRTRGTRTRKQLATWGTDLLQAPHWRPARWAVLALVAINLVGLQAWAWKEQSALAAKRAAIRNILTTTFPDVRVVVDAPLQMTRSLADLQRQSGAAASGDLETMLGLFQALAPEISIPTAIEFVAGELRLKVITPSEDAVLAATAKLQANGYSAVLDGDRLILKQERRP
jgi:general secretion pathway protein L